jgi:hypothetical protein
MMNDLEVYRSACQRLIGGHTWLGERAARRQWATIMPLWWPGGLDLAVLVSLLGTIQFPLLRDQWAERINSAANAAPSLITQAATGPIAGQIGQPKRDGVGNTDHIPVLPDERHACTSIRLPNNFLTHPAIRRRRFPCQVGPTIDSNTIISCASAGDR